MREGRERKRKREHKSKKSHRRSKIKGKSKSEHQGEGARAADGPWRMGQSLPQGFVDTHCQQLATDVGEAAGQLEVGQLLVFKGDNGYELRRLELISPETEEVRFHACDGCKKNRSRLKKEKVLFFSDTGKMSGMWNSLTSACAHSKACQRAAWEEHKLVCTPSTKKNKTASSVTCAVQYLTKQLSGVMLSLIASYCIPPEVYRLCLCSPRFHTLAQNAAGNGTLLATACLRASLDSSLKATLAKVARSRSLVTHISYSGRERTNCSCAVAVAASRK
jgi:hypothetical protein